MNSEAMNCNLKVNHYYTILLIITDNLIASTTCQIMPLKTLQIRAIKQIIKTMKQIIKATECNNWIIYCHMISLVITDSFVALSIWMIDETNHNLNVKMKPYCHLALSISSKWMSHTEHISQIMHCLSITMLKMSLHFTSCQCLWIFSSHWCLLQQLYAAYSIWWFTLFMLFMWNASRNK